MTDYISREAAIKAVEIVDFYKGSGIVPSGYASDAIRAIHAADVRPVVRGRWNKTAALAPFEDDRFECSVCGSWPWWCGVTDANLPNFCPNCGADMMEES